MLLADNMFSKYILYAFGEIVLVVVGILLALQVDAWNDEKQSNDEARLLLAQVQEELAFNIFKLNDGHNRYRAYDTCVHRVLQKEATYDDYKNMGKFATYVYARELCNLPVLENEYKKINNDVRTIKKCMKQLKNKNDKKNNKRSK